jgi:nitrite reductase/ring-hydroxylating ferredoxin subunit
VTRQVVARAGDVAPGTSVVVTVKGRDIGIFNLDGEYFALANRCPHAGGPLCQGRIVALVQSDGPGHYRLTRHREFLRCPWHGWEFEIRTGQSWCDPNSTRARQFAVTVEPGEQLVKGPYVAETFTVSVEEDYLVIDLAG